jgi:hypothetical protein
MVAMIEELSKRAISSNRLSSLNLTFPTSLSSISTPDVASTSPAAAVFASEMSFPMDGFALVGFCELL